MTGDREKCLTAGVDSYVAKPIDPDELSRAMADCVPKSRPAAPATAPKEMKEMSETKQPMDLNQTTSGHEGDGEASGLFDLDAALQRVAGEMKTIKSLANLLREEGPKMLQEIRDGLAGEDARRVQRGAHTIKGSAGIFAAERVVAAALRVETMGREGDLNGAAQAFPELKHQVERLCAAVAPLAEADGQ